MQLVDDNQFVADLFHALNQPLSALRCMLELAMNSPRTPADYQEYFRVGLEKVELANTLTQSMREFFEARDPAEAARYISLQECLREVADHFRPVAQDKGVNIVFCDDGDFHACCDPERLRRALFYIFDLGFYFIHGQTLEIQLEQQSSQLIFNLVFEALENEVEKLWVKPFSPKEPHWEQRLKWTTAQQLFRSEHGDLRLSLHDHQAHIVASIPLVNPAI